MREYDELNGTRVKKRVKNIKKVSLTLVLILVCFLANILPKF